MKDLEDILNSNFKLVAPRNLPDEESEYLNALQILLAKRIAFYINTDLDYLLQALYRIDVPQGQTDDAFEKGEVFEVANDLAKKIIIRQLQKLEYAKKFYNN
jgi:hypothetical protein